MFLIQLFMLLVQSILGLSQAILIRQVQPFDLMFIFFVLELILLYLMSKSQNLLGHSLVVGLGLIVSPL
jgi:hypothetical protein